MVVKKNVRKARRTRTSQGEPRRLGPANRIAYDIIAERRDLLPSVERIMNAGLNEDGTVGALTLFRASLGVTNDPNRDQAVDARHASASDLSS